MSSVFLGYGLIHGYIVSVSFYYDNCFVDEYSIQKKYVEVFSL
jgi:hypothetical protein